MQNCINEGQCIPFLCNKVKILQRNVHLKPVAVLLEVLWKLVAHLTHHTQIASRLGSLKLCSCYRQHLYSPSMSVGAYNVVVICTSCALERIKMRKHGKEHKRFRGNEPLTYVTKKILCLLLESNSGMVFNLVTMDRIFKLIKTVHLHATLAQNIARAFTAHWVFCTPYQASFS